MPFAITDEEQQRAQAQAQGKAPNISGQNLGFNVPGQAAASQAKTISAPKSSGQYQNIQKYLAANEEQAAQMGQKLAQGVEQKVAGAQQAGQQLQESVKAPEVYQPGQVLANLPGATEEQKKTYQTMKQTGGYTGPSDITSLQPYGEYFKQAEAAKEAVNLAGTEEGRQQLLKQQVTNPQYTRGQSILDQALIARSQGGQQAIQNIAQKYSGLADLLSGYETGAQKAIGKAKEQAALNIAQFAPAEQEAQKALLSPIEQRAQQANVEAEKYARIQKDLADLNLSPETIEALGLSPGQRLFNVNLGQFVTPALSQATAQNIATPEERQKYNELLNFIGANAGQMALGEPTYQQGKLDVGKAQAAIAQQASDFQTAVKNIAGLTGNPTIDIQTLQSQVGNYNQQLNALSDVDKLVGKDKPLIDAINSAQSKISQINQLMTNAGYSNVVMAPKDYLSPVQTGGGKLGGFAPTLPSGVLA